MIVRFNLRELNRELEGEIQSFLREFANELTNQLKAEAPVGATGDLRRSIQIFQTQPGVIWLGTRLEYAMHVWKGTPPHTPPFDPIEVWARRVIGDESAAGPVWQSIREEGTEPNDFVGRAVGNAVDQLA